MWGGNITVLSCLLVSTLLRLTHVVMLAQLVSTGFQTFLPKGLKLCSNFDHMSIIFCLNQPQPLIYWLPYIFFVRVHKYLVQKLVGEVP